MRMKCGKNARRVFAAGLAATMIGMPSSVLAAQQADGSGTNLDTKTTKAATAEGSTSGDRASDTQNAVTDSAQKKAAPTGKKVESSEAATRQDANQATDSTRQQSSQVGEPQNATQQQDVLNQATTQPHSTAQQSPNRQSSDNGSSSPRPVYLRDDQGRPIFQDAAGQLFVYMQDGWIVEQGQSTMPGRFESNRWTQAGGPQDANANQAFGQQWPLLGVRVADSDQGVRVVELVNDSAAANAGLMPGDVILRTNGEPITSAGTFVNRIRGMSAGDEVQLALSRDGKETTLNATLAGADQQRMAKPAISDSQASATEQQLRQQIQQLQREIEQLRGDANAKSAPSSDQSQNRSQSINSADSSPPAKANDISSTTSKSKDTSIEAGTQQAGSGSLKAGKQE